MHPIKSMIGYFNIHINTSLAFYLVEKGGFEPPTRGFFY